MRCGTWAVMCRRLWTRGPCVQPRLRHNTPQLVLLRALLTIHSSLPKTSSRRLTRAIVMTKTPIHHDSCLLSAALTSPHQAQAEPIASQQVVARRRASAAHPSRGPLDPRSSKSCSRAPRSKKKPTRRKAIEKRLSQLDDA